VTSPEPRTNASTGPERLGPLPLDSLTPDQRAVAQTLTAGPRGSLRGPFVPMIRSPALTDRVQHLGEYIRYYCAVPESLREFAILIAARAWNQTYEWFVHAPLAARAGVPLGVIGDLAASRRPAAMSADQAAIYDFCHQLHGDRAVEDTAYAAVLARLGEAGVVDLTGLCGYYAMLAMVLNVARSVLPAGASPFAIPAETP
jgi:4-carboxymuconolactone decarboxylase